MNMKWFVAALGILIFFQSPAFAGNDSLKPVRDPTLFALTPSDAAGFGLGFNPALSSEQFLHVPDFGFVLDAQTDPSPISIVAGGAIKGVEGRVFQSFSWSLPVGSSPNNFCIFKVSVKGEDGHPIHTLFAPISKIDSQPLDHHPGLVQYTVSPATFGFMSHSPENPQILTIESPILIGIESDPTFPLAGSIGTTAFNGRAIVLATGILFHLP